MKKYLFLALTLLSICAIPARAQDVGPLRHSISLTAGGPTGWIWYSNGMGYHEAYGTDLQSLYGPTRAYSYRTGFLLGYSFQVNEFRLGADLGYGSLIATETPGPALSKRPTKEQSQSLFSIVPNAEWTYDTGRYYSAYFKAGLGAELAVGDLGTRIKPAWEIVFLGLRLGRRLYFMSELGIGSEYICRAGIGYHF